MPALSIVLSCVTFRCLTHLPCILAHAQISVSTLLVILCKVDFGILMQGKESARADVDNL